MSGMVVELVTSALGCLIDYLRPQFVMTSVLEVNLVLLGALLLIDNRQRLIKNLTLLNGFWLGVSLSFLLILTLPLS